MVGAGKGQTLIDGDRSDRVLSTASNAKLTLSNLTVQNGYTSTATGAGIYAVSGLTLTNVDVLSNTSTSGGGGLGVTSTSATPVVTVTNSYFERNVCTNSGCMGGGMHANAPVALVDTDFFSNTGGTTNFGGGGLHAISGATITGGQFRYNAGFNGGALSSGSMAVTMVISGPQFIGNTTLTGGTGGAGSPDSFIRRR